MLIPMLFQVLVSLSESQDELKQASAKTSVYTWAKVHGVGASRGWALCFSVVRQHVLATSDSMSDWDYISGTKNAHVS